LPWLPTHGRSQRFKSCIAHSPPETPAVTRGCTASLGKIPMKCR
jgi:hypothetical protein